MSEIYHPHNDAHGIRNFLSKVALTLVFLAGFFSPVDALVRQAPYSIEGKRFPAIQSMHLPVFEKASRSLSTPNIATYYLLLDTNGQLKAIAPVSQPSPKIHTAAQQALKKWKFISAQSNGENVASLLRIRIEDYFYLKHTPSKANFVLPTPRFVLSKDLLIELDYALKLLNKKTPVEIDFYINKKGMVTQFHVEPQQGRANHYIQFIFEKFKPQLLFEPARQDDQPVDTVLTLRLTPDTSLTSSQGASLVEERPLPLFPKKYKESNSETITLEARIDASGSVIAAKCVEGKDVACQQSAFEALTRWKVPPASRDLDNEYFSVSFQFDAHAQTVSIDQDISWLRVVPPTIEKQHPVHYPDRFLGSGIKETVLSETKISADGAVTKIKVILADRKPFAQAAAQSLQHWKYSPGTVNGTPYAFTLLQPVEVEASSDKNAAPKN